MFSSNCKVSPTVTFAASQTRQKKAVAPTITAIHSKRRVCISRREGIRHPYSPSLSHARSSILIEIALSEGFFWALCFVATGGAGVLSKGPIPAGRIWYPVGSAVLPSATGRIHGQEPPPGPSSVVGPVHILRLAGLRR